MDLVVKGYTFYEKALHGAHVNDIEKWIINFEIADFHFIKEMIESQTTLLTDSLLVYVVSCSKVLIKIQSKSFNIK